MYFVIKPSGVIYGRTLGSINKRLAAKIDEVEMESVGADKIIKLNNSDIDFVQDKKRISLIPMSNLYKQDNMTKYLIIAIFVLQFFLLMKK